MNSIATLLQAVEYIERCERETKWQNLPDELVLKILSYLEVKDLISCGQLSKRTRNISQDGSLWVTANLEKKIVKTELLEMILLKGCKNLNLSNSTIVGHLRSNMIVPRRHAATAGSRNMISQLRILDLSQSTWGFPARKKPAQVYHKENISKIEDLLFSCCSLQNLKMEGLLITSKMAVSICKNGPTLQVLNLNHSFVQDTFDSLDYEVPNGDFQSIIKSCQQLKELDLNYVVFASHIANVNEGLSDDDLEILAKNVSPNVEKLNLINQDIGDELVKIMLSRSNKIKLLTLEASYISDESLKTIGQYLNLALRELTLGYHSSRKLFTHGFLELKFMPRLKILNIYIRRALNDCNKEIQNLRQHLPHLMIRTFYEGCFYSLENGAYLWGIQQLRGPQF